MKKVYNLKVTDPKQIGKWAQSAQKSVLID